MIEENGHKWLSGNHNARCVKCQMKLGFYLKLKQASREQPKREDLKKWMKCRETSEK